MCSSDLPQSADPAPSAADVDATALDSWCRERLAGYKVPRAIAFEASVSRSNTGKPDYLWAKEIASAAGL